MNKNILKRKKKNRKIITFMFIFFVINFFTYNYYLKLVELKKQKNEVKSSEIFLVSKSFLNREEFFYKDKEYLKNHSILKKEWETEYEGVKFYGQSESKEQKYNAKSTYNGSKTPTNNGS
ncbi:MAG: hypothetical protein ACRCZ9_03020 [Fusobacteriaceae bacterium]